MIAPRGLKIDEYPGGFTIITLRYKPLFFCSLLAVLILSACAPSSGQHGTRFFWPLPVGEIEPKIEYVGFFQADKDLRGLAQPGWLESTVLGEYPAVALFKAPFWVAFLPGQRIAVSDTVLRQVVILDQGKIEVRQLKDKNGEPYIFYLPMGIAASGAGEVFVLEATSGLILKFGADEKLIDTYGGKTVLSHPVDIAVNERDKLIYVSDVAEHNIAVFDLQGKLLYKIGERGMKAGQFNFPTGIDLDAAGNLYVLDTLNYRIQVLDSAGHFVREFGEQGTEIGSFRMPKGLAVSPQGQVYVSDVLSHKLVVFDLQGRYLTSLGGRSHARDGKVTPGGFFAPRGVAVDATGSILVVDGLNKMIQRFQYLTEDYLLAHPILEEEIYLPPVYRSMPRTSVVPVVKPAGDF